MSDDYALLIVGEPGGYEVWFSLPDHDPLNDPFGFIIGTGETRDMAAGDAVATLERAVNRLQMPPGEVPERVE